MWKYDKKLQYPVNIKTPNPKLAKAIISQLGGPDGELAASLRYLNQRFVMPYAEVKGILTDIGVSVSVYDILFALQVHSKRLCYHYSFRTFLFYKLNAVIIISDKLSQVCHCDKAVTSWWSLLICSYMFKSCIVGSGLICSASDIVLSAPLISG